MTEQDLHPLFSAEQVRRFAQEELVICLAPPPFRTLAQERDASGLWERICPLHRIDPERALVIGDFGIGSDAPIILDYTRHATNPPVRHPRWEHTRIRDWVTGAEDFAVFAAKLGLTDHIV